MSFRACIEEKVDSRLITKGQAASILKEFDQTVARYTRSMGDEAAAATAAQDLISAKIARLKEKKMRDINSMLAQERVVQDLSDRQRRFGTKFDEEVRNLLERAYVRGQSVMRWATEGLGEFVEKHRVRWAGLTQNREGMTDIVRSLLGEQTDNAEANFFGARIRQAFDNVHARYKAAGGVIGKLDNYFPQVHESSLVKKVDDDEWIEYLLPRLNREKMINPRTGLPFTDEELIPIMREDHELISTNGLSELQKKIDEGMRSFGFGSDVDMRRASSRFYHFRDADSFLEYNNRFGSGDDGLYDSIINHMQTMARDIGVLETLGPKPNGIYRHLQLRMEANTGKVKKAWTDGMYDVLVGRTIGDGNESPWYRGLAAVQDIMRSAYLGSAPVSALSDSTFGLLGARLNGLNGVRLMGRYLSSLNPANQADRRMMNRSGHIIEIATGSSIAAARFSDETTSQGFPRWLATFTNRASGLEAMTQGIKHAATMELQGTIAEFMHNRTAWSNLPEPFRKAAEAHDINEDVWKIFRKAKLFKHPEKNSTFLRPQEVAQAQGVDRAEAIRAATLLDDWSHTIRNTVSNEPTLRTRSISTGAILGDAKPGTANRAMMSSFMMFKGFPITVMFNHVLGAFKDAGQGKLGNLAILGLGTTIMGGLALQISEMIKGRDPRDMTDGKFWMAAMLKGGGMGLYGDFLFADYSRFGRSPVTDFFGPVVGLASDVGRVGVGSFQRALDDGSYDTLDRLRRDTFKLVKHNTPAHSLWYSRLVLERSLFDTLEQVADPNYNSNRRKIERRLKRDYGQRFWWAPGELSPDRGPDLEAAIQ